MEKVQIIATNLKILRSVLRLPQSRFAELFHMTQQNYQKYETGKAVPPADRLMEIAEALHIPASDLLEPPPKACGSMDNMVTGMLLAGCDCGKSVTGMKLIYCCLTPDEQEQYKSFPGTVKEFWMLYHRFLCT